MILSCIKKPSRKPVWKLAVSMQHLANISIIVCLLLFTYLWAIHNPLHASAFLKLVMLSYIGQFAAIVQHRSCIQTQSYLLFSNYYCESDASSGLTMPFQVQKSSFITTSQQSESFSMKLKLKRKTHKYNAYIIINQPLFGLDH